MSEYLELLLVKEGGLKKGEDVFPWATIQVEQNYDVMALMVDMGSRANRELPRKVIKDRRLPVGVRVAKHHDDGIRFTEKDAYGAPLWYTTAKEFRKVRLSTDVSPRNKAIVAFIGSLPDDTPIILFRR